jgi:histidinol phosphatase-like PHP family hydrolase
MGNPINSAARRAEPVLTALASRTGTLATFGVDGHRPEDLANFVSDRQIALRSTGQTKRLIERSSVDLSYSNLS